MQKKFCLIFLLIMIMLGAGQTLAQENAQDLLILQSGGDFWSWSENDGLIRLTEGGNKWDVTRSPDGRYLAYRAHSDFAVEALERGEYYRYEIVPSNIWLYDLQTDETQLIAAQPPNAIYSSEEFIGYVRATPQWSPDGTRLAWTQLAVGLPGRGYQLITYDLASGTEQMIADQLPGPYGDAGMVGSIGLNWEAVGILTETYGGNGDSDFFGQTFRLYDENGTQLAEHSVQMASEGLWNWYWSAAENGIIGYSPNEERSIRGFWHIDPFTNTEQKLEDSVTVVVTATAPDQLAFYVVDYVLDNEAYKTVHWWIPDTDLRDELTGTSASPFQLTISPDGQKIAYLTDALYIWENGETQRIPDTEQFAVPKSYTSLSWGDLMSRLYPIDELPFMLE